MIVGNANHFECVARESKMQEEMIYNGEFDPGSG